MQRSKGRKAKEVVHWQPTEAVKQKAPALPSYRLVSKQPAAIPARGAPWIIEQTGARHHSEAGRPTAPMTLFEGAGKKVNVVFWHD